MRPANKREEAEGTRRKLRLSEEQLSLLEHSFRAHSTLVHDQKRELAQRLQLQPRQVEVWFQNRRARSKLKQTEEDCESLRKCCQRLTNENRRLKRELMELRAATLRTCSSWREDGEGREEDQFLGHH
ncbi:Homeobox-leucine zipper protein [Musa troglodytarum]|uniref:Homeobox-leucine zipper protein n=1 Tax=Musa troglodytarum TaxID=320322 RepID=A0A9E7GX71_9LILI|nr:Homeobox-leucine zipper protein [Musa troglodytarum]